MKEFLNKKLMDRLLVLFKDQPDAYEFVDLYRGYIHLIDDIIDEPNFKTPEHILKLTALASRVFTCKFWLTYGHALIVTEQLINNTYADSVIWEKSTLRYQTTAADTLRHTGLDMFFAVILIVFGRDILREVSAEFREQCHLIQDDSEITPT